MRTNSEAKLRLDIISLVDALKDSYYGVPILDIMEFLEARVTDETMERVREALDL